MRKGVIVLLGFLLLVFIMYQGLSKPMKQGDVTVIKESVINDIGINDSVERVITYFGQQYTQEEQKVALSTLEEPELYLVYIYPDARIYVEDRLVKAVELITPSYPSPRGCRVGDSREEVERVYWRPVGYSGQEERYVYEFNTYLAFEFDEVDRVKKILLH